MYLFVCLSNVNPDRKWFRYSGVDTADIMTVLHVVTTSTHT